MTLIEIKKELENLSQDEVCYLAVYLKHLSRRGDVAYRKKLDEQWESCSEGGLSLQDLKGIDEQLRKSGI